MAVYFLQDPYGDVKIGHSREPLRRVQSLQTGSVGLLTLVRIIDGAAATEKWLHRRFSAYRRRGEWFAFHDDMMTVCPPDEVPQIRQCHRGIRLTLKETIRQHDKFPFLPDHALASLLATSFREDDIAAFLDWVRRRTGVAGCMGHADELDRYDGIVEAAD